MITSEPVKNQDNGKTEINILNISDDQIYWLHQAVTAYQGKGDPDDYNALAAARDWMDTAHAAFKKMRPS